MLLSWCPSVFTRTVGQAREHSWNRSAVLTCWRPGRNREKREQQRAAGKAVLEWLRDQEVASAADFKEVVEPEHPVDDQSPSTWWKKTGREASRGFPLEPVVSFPRETLRR